MSPPGTWPEVNDRIRVRLDLPSRLGGDEVDLHTRVEDVRDGLLVIAAPTFAGDLHVAQEGLEVTGSWATERGHCRQDFALVAVVRLAVPCWELRPVGDVVKEQRRRFVRVPVVGRGRLAGVPLPVDPHAAHPRSGDGPPGLQGGGPAADGSGDGSDPAGETSIGTDLVDLSEGGACVRSRAAAWLEAGRQVLLSFEVDGGPVEQLADVLRVSRGPGPSALDPAEQRFDAVLSFVEPVAAADRVRRYVMRIQIENRRRGER